MEDVGEAAFKLVFRAIAFLLRVVGQLLFEAVAQLICYSTARLLAPVMSLGYVSVEKLRGPPSRFNAWGVKRNPDGGIVLGADLATLLGLVVWMFSLIGFALWMSFPAEAVAIQVSSFAITSSEIS